MTSRSRLLALGLGTWGGACAVACGFEMTLDEELLDDVEDILDETNVEFTMVHTRYEPSSQSFVELSPPPKKRNLFSAHSLAGRVYVLGGVNEDGNYVGDLESYDRQTDSWVSHTSWPRPGFAFSAVVGDHLCAFAGYQDFETPLRSEVDCYDPEADEWQAGPDLPEDYSSAYPAVLGGRIYLFGGTDADLTFFDSAWSYAPGESEWREQTPLPEGRAFMGVQAVSDKIYVIGGFDENTFDRDDDEARHDQMMYIYDPQGDSWSEGPGMPHGRALYGLDDVDGRLAVFFGVTDGPLVEFYDPESGVWSEGTDPPELPSGGVYTYAKHAEAMYLLAIADGASSSSLASSGSLFRYEPTGDKWAEVAERSDEHLDALFSGTSHDSGVHFVGAHTSISYDPDSDPDPSTGGAPSSMGGTPGGFAGAEGQ